MLIAVLLAGLLLGGSAVFLLLRRVADARVAGAVSQATAAGMAEASRAAAELEAARARLAETATALQSCERDRDALRAESARLQAEKASLATLNDQLQKAQQQLKDSFAALSSEALQRNNRSFLDLARQELDAARTVGAHDLDERRNAIDQLVKPIGERLQLYDQKIADLEKARASTYGQLAQQLSSVSQACAGLYQVTSSLAGAMKSPSGRGQWGEIQLRRVAEMAGMLEYCDFDTQHYVSGEDGGQRPDMVVRLPGDRIVVVDAKVPLDAYLDAQADGLTEEQRQAKLAQHVAQVRAHMAVLSQKNYARLFKRSPDFVFMFLPAESIFREALVQDASLIEECNQQHVILASPVTLITLLRVVGQGWREERLGRNAEEISRIGRELHDRLATLTGHLDGVGKSLNTAVTRYNQAIGSFTTRVVTSARRFKELGAAGGDDLPELSTVDVRARSLGEDAIVPEPVSEPRILPQRDGTDPPPQLTF